jgi:hypothetical protein
MNTSFSGKFETENREFTTLPSKKSLSALIKIYLSLVVMLVMIKMILALTPVRVIMPAQAAGSSWQFLIPLTILGLVGVWLSQKTGFPEMGDASAIQWFPISALLGLGAAGILILLNLIQPLGAINVPFPISILFYVQGAIETEIVLHLIPIPLLLWLISSLILRNRWQEQVFWGVAIVLSLCEPLGMISAISQTGLLEQSIIPMFMILVSYSMNLIGAYLFRKFGFLAPLTMRLSLYLAWHVVFGALMKV